MIVDNFPSLNPLPNTANIHLPYGEISLMIVDNFPPLNPLPNTANIPQVYSELNLMIADHFPCLNPLSNTATIPLAYSTITYNQHGTFVPAFKSCTWYCVCILGWFHMHTNIANKHVTFLSTQGSTMASIHTHRHIHAHTHTQTNKRQRGT